MKKTITYLILSGAVLCAPLQAMQEEGERESFDLVVINASKGPTRCRIKGGNPSAKTWGEDFSETKELKHGERAVFKGNCLEFPSYVTIDNKVQEKDEESSVYFAFYRPGDFQIPLTEKKVSKRVFCGYQYNHYFDLSEFYSEHMNGKKFSTLYVIIYPDLVCENICLKEGSNHELFQNNFIFHALKIISKANSLAKKIKKSLLKHYANETRKVLNGEIEEINAQKILIKTHVSLFKQILIKIENLQSLAGEDDLFSISKDGNGLADRLQQSRINLAKATDEIHKLVMQLEEKEKEKELEQNL
jgi:hypothetical protein